MNISYNWLKKYINIDLPAEDVSKILTSIGLEVESIDDYESIKGGMAGFVVGEVITCIKHPNADKLSVTIVNIGTTDLLQIVCGAPNVTAGQKVIVATVGTKIYKGEESFTIQKTKIRGEVSQGMICAEDEIGIGNSHEGILVLDSSAVAGCSTCPSHWNNLMQVSCSSACPFASKPENSRYSSRSNESTRRC